MLSHPQVQFTHKGQAAFPSLSKSVLSIIHEMCFQFFSDSTQYISAASLSFHAYMLAGLARLFPRGRLTSGLQGAAAAAALSHFNATRAAARRLDDQTWL